MTTNMLPIQLVTFDLYDTLIELYPPRWERLARVLESRGLSAEVDKLRLGDFIAEDYWTEENTAKPIRDRTIAERDAIRNEYIRRWLAAAGFDLSPAQAADIRQHYRAEYEQSAREAVPGLIDGYRTFPDVNRTMQNLRSHGVRTAVISNADADVTEFCQRLNFAHEMDLIVTSATVGFEKPDVRTFRAALEPLGIAPERALHIGDQPRSDVVGALGAGMQAALIDRYERHDPAHHEAPVFTTLDALVAHVTAVNAEAGAHP